MLGDLAEAIILEYERKRLKELGYLPESECVKSIGKKRVNAGFDIESFDGESRGMQHDRFIEVKGSGKKSLRFIWSKNEIEVAKKLGKKYWIYYQGGINKKLKKASVKPLIFQDP